MAARNNENPNADSEYKEVLVSVKRVAKVVKGGRRFGFSVVIVAGNGQGLVGYGLGKAKEVMEAKTKASQAAKKAMIKVYIKENRTIHHDIVGSSGAGKVLLRSAPAGTGIIAGGSMRAVFEMLGLQDVVAKSIGSQNPYNMIRATIDGLKAETSPRQVAARRGKKVAEILNKPAAETVEA